MKKKILLIAFKFPPYAGVGGFRWSKLCKYLARLDHQIHVVTVPWKVSSPNSFIQDVQHPNIHIHTIPSGYPHNLKYWYSKYRIINLLNNQIRKSIDSVLAMDDEAQYWGRYLIPYCEKLIKSEALQVVVATGHPFQANRWASLVKKRNPSIRLVQDFRDPWAKNNYRNISTSLQRKIACWEKESITYADRVVAVTQGLLNIYMDKNSSGKGIVIQNGYDPESVASALHKASKSQHGKTLRFIHIGTLVDGRSEPLHQFLNVVRRIHGNPNNLKVVLLGKVSMRTQLLYKDLIRIGALEVSAAISQKEAFNLVKEHDYALHFNARAFPFLVSTKIYEYAALQIPTLSINYGGEIHSLVMENSLGYSVHADNENIEKKLLHLSKDPKETFTFNITPFSYIRLSEKYSTLIEAL